MNLFSVKGRLLRADIVLVWKIVRGMCGVSADQLFILCNDSITRGHPFKIYLQHSRLECRKRFFASRVVQTWNSLSPATVMADSLTSFKRHVALDLGDMLYEYYK